MSDYESYCAALQLVVDGPGTGARDADEITAVGQQQLDTALRRDREVQQRWSDADRRSRDFGARVRRLTDFVGAGAEPAALPLQAWDLSRIEAELASIERDLPQLEAAMDWVNRARRQVIAERSKLT